jgi:uncharacterized membrane protein YoaK (UPF0700 family)
MQPNRNSKRNSRPPHINAERFDGLARLSTHMATTVTRSWGPMLAFIALLAIVGILFAQVAHSDAAVIGIVVIVVVAIVTAAFVRIRNVL